MLAWTRTSRLAVAHVVPSTVTVHLNSTDDMNDKVQKLIAAMDEKLWLRMLVLLLPGLILGKLAGQFPGLILGVVGTVSLVVGMTAFLLWPRIRSLLLGIEESNEEAGDDVLLEGDRPTETPSVEAPAGEETAKLMAGLLELFGGSGAQMLDAIQMELDVNSRLSYAEAVEMAHRRKQIQKARS